LTTTPLKGVQIPHLSLSRGWQGKSIVVIITIIMESDDISIGRVLGRREVVALLGFSGVALAAGRALAQQRARAVPGCVVRPQQTEGPYFVDEKLNRSDIRSDPTTAEVRAGAGLDLAFNVSRLGAGTCAPLTGAIVDVWHCDALGVYSDVRDPGGSTVGKRFLRGYQTTNAAGLARFTTIYPGWYPGRAVHIHFKVRTAQGQEFTSQIYFDDALTDRIHALEPYARRGQRRLRNEDDGIFHQGGRELVVVATPSGPGYAATFDIALSL
jgi:protocatechuate 3,4-dioxygenase beta subunit